MLRQSDHCQGGPRPSWTFGAGAPDEAASCLASTPDGATERWQLVPCDASKPATTCQTWGSCDGGSAATFCTVAPDHEHHFDQFGGHILFFNDTTLSLAAVAWRFFEQFH